MKRRILCLPLKISDLNSKESIFSRLQNGGTVLPDDPEIHHLREAFYEIKNKLNQLNNSSDPDKISELLSVLTLNKCF